MRKTILKNCAKGLQCICRANRHQAFGWGGVIGVALPYFLRGLTWRNNCSVICRIGGEELSKEELKREIVELVDQCDSERFLGIIYNFVKRLLS